jgi:hypothetical protein
MAVPPNMNGAMTPQALPVGSQVCSINIMFVTASDDEAMAVKRKVTEALTNVKTIRSTFTMNGAPSVTA